MVGNDYMKDGHEHFCIDCEIESRDQTNVLPIYRNTPPIRRCWCIAHKDRRDIKCWRHDSKQLPGTNHNPHRATVTTYSPSVSGQEMAEKIREELNESN